jgi:TRAP-type C4-dicarboxylate transport system permease small subunit
MFKSVLHFLDEYLEMGIGVVLILVIAVVLSIQVFMRYVMDASLSWSEELARYLFIWLIYIGISYGAKVMRHIKIDAGLYLFPKAARPFVVIIGDLVFLAFCGVVIWYSYQLVLRQIMIEQHSPAMNIPMWMVYAAPMVGFALTAVREVQTIAWRVRHLHDGADRSDPLEGL